MRPTVDRDISLCLNNAAVTAFMIANLPHDSSVEASRVLCQHSYHAVPACLSLPSPAQAVLKLRFLLEFDCSHSSTTIDAQDRNHPA